MLRRLLVMFAHVLEVMHLKAVAFEIGYGEAHMVHLAAGENVAVGEFLVD